MDRFIMAPHCNSTILRFHSVSHDMFNIQRTNSSPPSAAYICVIELGHHWFRKWLVAYLASSHYLSLCWNIVDLTLRNKLQWNLNRNSCIFIQENAFEMSSGKWRPFCLGLNILMTHTCRCGLDHHRFRELPVAISVPSHCLNQCWLMFSWTQMELKDNLSEISIKIPSYLLKEMHFKSLFAKWWLFYCGLLLIHIQSRISIGNGVGCLLPEKCPIFLDFVNSHLPLKKKYPFH